MKKVLVLILFLILTIPNSVVLADDPTPIVLKTEDLVPLQSLLKCPTSTQEVPTETEVPVATETIAPVNTEIVSSSTPISFKETPIPDPTPEKKHKPKDKPKSDDSKNSLLAVTGLGDLPPEILVIGFIFVFLMGAWLVLQGLAHLWRK